MTTGLQLVIAAGALLGLGAALLLMRLLPPEPDLADALGRLTPNMTRVTSTPTAGSGKERIGLWAIRTLPPALWVRTPTRELALLRIPLARFYADKLTFAALGLVIPPLLGSFLDLLGLHPRAPPPPPPPPRRPAAGGGVVFFPPTKKKPPRRRPQEGAVG